MIDLLALAPFIGTWTGLTTGDSPGLVSLQVSLPTPDSALIELDFDAMLVAGVPIASWHVEDGVLVLRHLFGHVSLRRVGDRLVGEIDVPAVSDAPFELRRGHPGSARYLVPDLADGRRYRVPETTDDGWRTASLADAGLDQEPVEQLIAEITAGDLPWVDSVVMSVGGKLVVDEYFYGRERQDLHTLQSATKSVASMLLGVLVDSGAVDLDAPAWTYFADRPTRHWVADQVDVPVRRVLSMSAGVEWEEMNVPYSDPRNDNMRMNMTDDWVGYVLDCPVRADWPADRFDYQSGLSILVGGLIRAASGMTVEEFARKRLFPDLGIERFRWIQAGDGTAHTGGGLLLQPRDFLKLGQLMLDGGRWSGRDVLSAEWVTASLSEQSRIVEPLGAVSPSYSYGFQWWRNRFQVGDRAVYAVSAMGFGGQYLHLLPDLNAVIACNAHDWRGAGGLVNLPTRHLLPMLLAGR